jgi:hypothetical protein
MHDNIRRDIQRWENEGGHLGEVDDGSMPNQHGTEIRKREQKRYGPAPNNKLQGGGMKGWGLSSRYSAIFQCQDGTM